MKKVYIHFLVLILLIIQGCAFKPGGEEFVKLDPNGKSPNIEVDLNLATDTIYIQKNANLTFVYALNGEEVNWAQFIINGKETELIKDLSRNSQLAWHFDNNSAGTYPLEMKIFTKSHTGSIGDKLGAEGFLISRKWIMVVVDQIASNINKYEFVDGSLKIEWEKYKGVDFKSYKVYKNTVFMSNQTELVATINTREQASFIDNNFHGENSSYYIKTNDEFYGTPYLITVPLPVLSASNAITGDILLKWIKPPFYNNLKGYRISYRDNNGNIQQLAELNTTAESFIIPNPLFAFNYEIYLSLLPLSVTYDPWDLIVYLSSKTTTSYGMATPNYTIALGGLAPISYLLNNTEGIAVFDHQKLTTTRQIKYDDQIKRFDVSANNKYLVSVLSTPRKIYFEDLVNTANSKKIDLSVTFPQMGQTASVSNVGTGVILNGQSAVLYDYAKESKLAEIKVMFNSEYDNKISPSGNFFFCETYFTGNEYFQYKDNQIIRLKGDTPGVDFVLHADYLPGNNEKLVRAFANRVEVVDCNTWTVEKKWQFTNQIIEVYNLDMKSGKLLLRENNKLILFDVMNGTREELINIGGFPTTKNQWTLFYNNGQVLWSEGKAMI